MVANDEDCFLARLTHLRQVVPQLLNQARHDVIRLYTEVFALAISKIRVKLGAEICEESDRPLAYTDNFVPNSMPDHCNSSDEGRRIEFLLDEHLVFQ